MHFGIVLFSFFSLLFFWSSHAIPDRKCFNDLPSGEWVYVSIEMKFWDRSVTYTNSQMHYNLLDTITSHRLNTEISMIVLPLDWHRDTDDSSRTFGPIPNHTHGSTTSETSWIILCLRSHMSLQKKPSLISCFIFFHNYHSFLSSEIIKEKTPVPHQSERENARGLACRFEFNALALCGLSVFYITLTRWAEYWLRL